MVHDQRDPDLGDFAEPVVVRFSHGAVEHFEDVGHAVQCAVGGQGGRGIVGRRIIEDRIRGHDRLVHDQLLLAGRQIGDIGVFGQMGAGAGGGLNGDVRRQPQAGCLESFRDQARSEVLVDVSAQRAQDLRCFGRVDRAAAAEADDHVGIRLPQRLGDSQQILARGVRPGSRNPGYEAHAGLPDGVANDIETGRGAGESGVNQRSAASSGSHDIPNVLENVAAEQVVAAFELLQ